MTELAKRYGGSLYELAAEESLTESILQELALAESSCKQEPEYLRLLQIPSIPKRERCELLDKAFEGMHPYVVNFLKILCEEDLLGELTGCLDAYRERYNEDHGILEATVTSAVPLTAEERANLLAKLQAKTGKTISLTEKVDPSILGGLRLDLAGERLDGTVLRRLELLRDDIANVVL
ncbi:ATP synthase F1 subunit delta [Gemmiger formicilis]|uniref:ATP synthase subunit delta n=1 Tax=Subdoligranulum variabile TaxID=214851 RepID=A0A921IKT2_9FIRM|nr:ATP synthase F1 subunit delta [Gemmiger formicilis]MBM6898166.1 ATP synthase F1 subunit delta [Gemmiger formicilis]HJG28667.1 ATP synthase F1 subunit delta [Subdoligranulum variabile]